MSTAFFPIEYVLLPEVSLKFVIKINNEQGKASSFINL